ncbi:16744_t:CDS:2 [Dentiscutata heterogama]|uniref:16744_t:CDS:1 n=1 Tax=Dentiscutata heterogama TaxID=1316150 RepID=A0ACA9KTF5_9GLOM|nr:16744_t:CDS:2 [Dentiscutata heterogama]
MLVAIQLKKGYYIRHVKEGLWSIFGVNRIKPDPDDLNFETFFSLIIKYVFVSDDEHTQANAVWTQAILETIFDKDYVSPKIDIDYVDMWIQKLTNNENIYKLSPAMSKAKSLNVIQENYNELSLNSANNNENNHNSDSNYEE